MGGYKILICAFLFLGIPKCYGKIAEVTLPEEVLNLLLGCQQRTFSDSIKVNSFPGNNLDPLVNRERRKENLNTVDFEALRSQLEVSISSNSMINNIIAQIESTLMADQYAKKECIQLTVNTPAQNPPDLKQQTMEIIEKNNNLQLENINIMINNGMKLLYSNVETMLNEKFTNIIAKDHVDTTVKSNVKQANTQDIVEYIEAQEKKTVVSKQTNPRHQNRRKPRPNARSSFSNRHRSPVRQTISRPSLSRPSQQRTNNQHEEENEAVLNTEVSQLDDPKPLNIDSTTTATLPVIEILKEPSESKRFRPDSQRTPGRRISLNRHESNVVEEKKEVEVKLSPPSEQIDELKVERINSETLISENEKKVLVDSEVDIPIVETAVVEKAEEDIPIVEKAEVSSSTIPSIEKVKKTKTRRRPVMISGRRPSRPSRPSRPNRPNRPNRLNRPRPNRRNPIIKPQRKFIQTTTEENIIDNANINLENEEISKSENKSTTIPPEMIYKLTTLTTPVEEIDSTAELAQIQPQAEDLTEKIDSTVELEQIQPQTEDLTEIDVEEPVEVIHQTQPPIPTTLPPPGQRRRLTRPPRRRSITSSSRRREIPSRFRSRTDVVVVDDVVE